MKNGHTVLIALGFIVVGAGVLVGTQKVASNFLTSKVDSSGTSCTKAGTAHTATISNDRVEPLHTKATLCDTLTIINQDDKVRNVAFGVHDKHIMYDGITQRTLAKDESFTVSLNQTGTYLFHDHYQEVVGGDFTVSP